MVSKQIAQLNLHYCGDTSYAYKIQVQDIHVLSCILSKKTNAQAIEVDTQENNCIVRWVIIDLSIKKIVKYNTDNMWKHSMKGRNWDYSI